MRAKPKQDNDLFRGTLKPFSKRKQQILEETAKLIVKKGFAATSMNDIAAQLGINKASLYYHCKNKEEISLDIETLNYQYNIKVFELAESSCTTGLDKLRFFFIAYTKLMTSHIGAAAIQIALTPHSPELEQRYRKFFRRVDGKVRGYIVEGQQDGSIADVDVKWLDFILFGTLHWIPKWYSDSKNLTPAALGDELFEALCKGIISS